jgi:hypothetical protein
MGALSRDCQPRGPVRVHANLPRRGRHTVPVDRIARDYLGRLEKIPEKIWNFNKKHLPFREKMLYNGRGFLYAPPRRRAREGQRRKDTVK